MIGETSRRTDGSYVTTFVAAQARQRSPATAPPLPVSTEKSGGIDVICDTIAGAATTVLGTDIGTGVATGGNGRSEPIARLIAQIGFPLHPCGREADTAERQDAGVRPDRANKPTRRFHIL